MREILTVKEIKRQLLFFLFLTPTALNARLVEQWSNVIPSPGSFPTQWLMKTFSNHQ
jgi:hypothetical protein